MENMPPVATRGALPKYDTDPGAARAHRSTEENEARAPHEVVVEGAKPPLRWRAVPVAPPAPNKKKQPIWDASIVDWYTGLADHPMAQYWEQSEIENLYTCARYKHVINKMLDMGELPPASHFDKVQMIEDRFLLNEYSRRRNGAKIVRKVNEVDTSMQLVDALYDDLGA